MNGGYNTQRCLKSNFILMLLNIACPFPHRTIYRINDDNAFFR